MRLKRPIDWEQVRRQLREREGMEQRALLLVRDCDKLDQLQHVAREVGFHYDELMQLIANHIQVPEL